jgi:hypothetical protein
MELHDILLPLILGSIFGILAGASAYLITYQEYIHHFPDKIRPRKMALRMAIVAFFFFVTSIIIVWIIFLYLFSKSRI